MLLFVCRKCSYFQASSINFQHVLRDLRAFSVFVKSTSPLQKNGYENCIYSMNNIHMSNEDNKHDTNYINKHKCTNHDTRKLHL